MSKNFKNLVIYFFRNVYNKLIKILILHYRELLGIIEEHEVKKTYLIVDGYILNTVLDKIKETIDVDKFDDTKILIHMDDSI